MNKTHKKSPRPTGSIIQLVVLFLPIWQRALLRNTVGIPRVAPFRGIVKLSYVSLLKTQEHFHESMGCHSQYPEQIPSWAFALSTATPFCFVVI